MDEDEDLESEDEENPSHEEENEEQQEEQPSEEDEETRLLAKFGNDPKAVAREYIRAQQYLGTRGNEIGELRRQVQELQQAVQTRSGTREESDSSTGFPKDEFGIEVIPEELWYSEGYLAKVEQKLIDDGLSPERAVARAPIVAMRNRDRWQEEYLSRREERLSSRNVTEEEWVKAQLPVLEAVIKEQVSDIQKRVSRLAHPDNVPQIVADIETRVRASIEREYRTGGARAVYDEKFVKKAYRDAYADFDFEVGFDKFAPTKDQKIPGVRATSTGVTSPGARKTDDGSSEYTRKFNALGDREKTRIQRLANATGSTVAEIMKTEEEYDGS